MMMMMGRNMGLRRIRGPRSFSYKSRNPRLGFPGSTRGSPVVFPNPSTVHNRCRPATSRSKLSRVSPPSGNHEPQREEPASSEDLPYTIKPCAGNRARPAVPSWTAEARVRQHTRGRAEGRQMRVQRRLQQHQPVRRNADGHDKPPQASVQREQAEVGYSDRVSRSSSSGSSS
ncbi:hypothetical protein quinque_013062 [Culex quinquefasciatus]